MLDASGQHLARSKHSRADKRFLSVSLGKTSTQRLNLSNQITVKLTIDRTMVELEVAAALADLTGDSLAEFISKSGLHYA